MKWRLWKGKWDSWLKSEDVQLSQWFRGLDDYLSRAFRRRISLRDNLFCRILEENSVPIGAQQERKGVLEFVGVEGVLVLQSSEPVTLTWSASGQDLSFFLSGSAPSTSLKLAIFYREA